MILSEEDYLAHYGILRKSGRYPWGSGGQVAPSGKQYHIVGSTVEERSRSFIGTIADLRREGLTDKEIAEGFGMKTTEFRNISSIAKNEKRQADVNMAQRLKDKGMGNVAIGQRMGGVSESQVRALLAPGVQDRLNVLKQTSEMLRRQIDDKNYVDVGSGVEYHLNVSREKLDSAIAQLREEGYGLHYIKVPQVTGLPGQNTTMKVLAAPGIPWKEVNANAPSIEPPFAFSETGGRSYLNMKHMPMSIDLSRVGIRYAEQGGDEADGVMYIRRGVEDVSIGSNRYAQVRVAVNGTHYIKGMAIYKDDLPPGIDILFNSNKSNSGDKLDALKPMATKDGKIDQENPFAASIKRQIIGHDAKGNEKVTSVMNIVNEEGDWANWSKSLSSQFLSKQAPALAKSQLDMTYEKRVLQLDAIKKLTNPAVRRILLDKFAEKTDSAAVDLKAASLPRQSNHVILPIPTLKETEVYAPNYINGERVVLIRHPHAGVFEIPELTVNNKHAGAKKLMGDAEDAIGIHPKVAAKLSGADFDGDAVLVIPNNGNKIKTAAALDKLRTFDPQKAYPVYPGMKHMTPHQTQTEMGMITNLISDMTIQRASTEDIVRAVRHSMVVIDAEKKGLDFRQSALDHGIKDLKIKYQGAATGGAATLITKSRSDIRVEKRRPRTVANGGPIDKKTGELKYEPAKDSRYVDKNGKVVIKTTKSTKMAETNDARTLVSKNGGTKIEHVYADHANKLKNLANQARLESLNTKSVPKSPSAQKHYAPEIKSLQSKLNLALRNKPLERKAQLLANANVDAIKNTNPNMDSASLKRVKSQAMYQARRNTGASKHQIQIEPNEWEAIQAHAIANDTLTKILNHADLDKVRALATPKTALLMSPTNTARAKSMLASGYTQAEVAAHLGVSLTTLKNGL